MFAAHSALALGHARRQSQLREAIATRQVIGQATGIVMERFQLAEQQAFDYLLRVSSHGNIKLRDVATQIIASVGKG